MRRRAISAPAALAAALVAPLALAGCMRTATYGTGEMPEVAMFQELTGGVLSKGEKKEPIAYQPRAPLVMPPTASALPPPAETAAGADPNWPLDPNERLLADAPPDDGNPMNDINQAEYRRLRPLASVMPGQSNSPQDLENGKSDYYSNIVHGRRMREEFAQALAEANGYGNRERRYLTDPPTEYREPEPTAMGEFESAKKNKKPGFFARLFGAS